MNNALIEKLATAVDSEITEICAELIRRKLGTFAKAPTKTNTVVPKGTITSARPTKEVFVQYLKDHTLEEAAEYFGVHRGSICRWRKEYKLGRKVRLKPKRLRVSAEELEKFQFGKVQ